MPVGKWIAMDKGNVHALSFLDLVYSKADKILYEEGAYKNLTPEERFSLLEMVVVKYLTGTIQKHKTI